MFLKRKKVLQLITKKVDISQEFANEVINAFGYIVAETIKRGLSIEIPYVGIVKTKKVYGKKTRIGFRDVKNGIKEELPATKDFDKPYCKFKQKLRDELRELTYGKPFEDDNDEEEEEEE